ncbi:MAG: phage tail sheath family protein, partial [Oscillospiraceae bacterium]
EQFFINGGSRAFIMRVAPQNAKSAESKMGAVTITARNAGSWGNIISTTVMDTSRAKLQFIQELENNSYRVKSTMGVVVGDELFAVGDSGREYNRIIRINEDV